MMLFSPYPIGTRLVVGVDASYWNGHYAGIQIGVAILRNAQLFANPGKPVDGIRPVVRIPICKVTFIAVDDHKDDKENKDQK